MAQEIILSTDNLNAGRNKINNNFDFLFSQTGWASYVDNDYTSGAPFVVSSGSTVNLTNRAKSIIEPQIPSDIKTFYCPVELVISSLSGNFIEGETITGVTSGATGTLKEKTGSKYRITNLTGSFLAAENITGGTSLATATIDSKKNALIIGRNGDNLDIMLYFKALPSTTNAELEIWVDIGGGIGELYKQTIYFRGTTEKGVLYTLPSAYTLNTWEANGGEIKIKAIGGSFDIYNMNFNFDRSHKAR